MGLELFSSATKGGLCCIIMILQIHHTASEFLEVSQALLEKQEAENNLILGLANTLVRDINYYGDQHPLFITLMEDGKCVAACVQTPPYNLILFAVKEHLDGSISSLCNYLIENNIDFPGIIGPIAVADKFIDTWTTMKKDSFTLVVDEMVYRLDSVTDISISNGKLRLAKVGDLDLISKWMGAFYVEALYPIAEKEARTESLKRIKEGAFYIWEDGRPMAMAGKTRPTKNGISVAYVYTPTEHRKKGYASSCVTKLSQLLLKDYKFCTLFTDLSNPTSNNIYKKIGYKAVNQVHQYKKEKRKS